MTTMRDSTPIAGQTPWQLVCSLLWRHKIKVVTIPLAMLLLAAGVILYCPRTYYSEARLFLRVGRETIGLDPTATTGQVIGMQQLGQQSEVLSAIDLLGSGGVLGRVVDELGPGYILSGGPTNEDGGKNAGRELPGVVQAALDAVRGAIATVQSLDPVSEREKALIACGKGLKLDAEKNSTVIVVRYETDTPLGAQQITQKIVDVYQQEHLRIHRNPQSRDFFEEQRDRFRAELAATQGRLRDAKNRMGLASLEARRAALEEQLQAIELARYNTEQALATAAARVNAIGDQIKATPERMLSAKRLVPNVGADTLRDRLYELQLRELELKSKYSDAHPLVRAAAAQLAEAKQVVEQQDAQREETTDDINPIHRELSLTLTRQQNEVSGLRGRVEMLGKQRDAVMAGLEEINGHEVEIRDLEREVAIVSAKRMRYEEDYEQARIDRELDASAISSVAIAQSPSFNEKPVSPSKVFVLAGAVLAAVGLTGGWIVAKEQLHKPLGGGVPLARALPTAGPANDSGEVKAVYIRAPAEKSYPAGLPK